MRFVTRLTRVCGLMLLVCVPFAAQARMGVLMRYPTIHGDTIVFEAGAISGRSVPRAEWPDASPPTGAMIPMRIFPPTAAGSLSPAGMTATAMSM